MRNESRDELVIVVTGFGPFQTVSENPSEKIVRRLADKGVETKENCTLITEIMPVAYHDVNQAVFRLWKTYKPDLVIHVGAHPDSRTVYLEQQSFGSGYDCYDVRAQIPAGKECPRFLLCESDENVILTGFDCTRIVENASSKLSCDNLLWKVSQNPGRYLCAYSYFISLTHDRNKSLFVHVPAFDEEVTEDVVFEALRLIIKECVLQISSKGK